MLILLLACGAPSPALPDAPDPSALPAPEPSIPPAPDAPDLDASEAPDVKEPAAPALPAALVIDEHVVACQSEDDPDGLASGTDCSGSYRAWSPAPLLTGPIRLRGRSILAQPESQDAGPCSDMVVAVPSSTPDEQTRTLREGAVIPPTSARYTAALGEALGLKSAPVSALFRVDLDGNGTDEVLFNVDSHPELWPMSASSNVVAASGVRMVDGDGVSTRFFHRHVVKAGSEPSSMLMIRGQIIGLSDLDNDGTFEVIVEGGYYEGFSYHVYSVPPKGESVLLAEVGCGA